MGSMSTFGTFTMARLGIYVAQHALNVTGNNITNINTTGYTRQQLKQTSMYFGTGDRYLSTYDIRSNGGVLAQGVYQLRDQYLDIRYRNESTRVGEATGKLNILQQLSDIFDEVAKGDDGDGVLEARFNDFIQQLENLSKPENSNKDDMDSIVRSAAEALTTQFHDYARQLEALKQITTARFRDEVEATNTILSKIRELNEDIRKSEIFGGSALTLRDERNLLIDDLAGMMGIHVTYEMEDLGNGIQVEKMKITTSGDPKRTLIDGIYGSQLTILNENNYDLSLSQLKDGKGKLKPGQPNRTEEVLSGVEVSSRLEKATTRFSEEEVDAMLETLNGDTKYTLGNDGTEYRYVKIKESGTDSNSKWVIQRFEVESWNTDGTPKLKDGNNGTKNTLTYVEAVYTRQTKLSDTELIGGLQAMREMMTEAGEYATANDPALKTDDPLHYDPDAGNKRGIPYYQKTLDALAKKFAEIMNKANMMQPEEIYQTDENGNLPDYDPAHYVPELGFEGFFEKEEDGSYVYETDENGKYVFLTDDDGNYLTDADGNRIVKLKIKAEYKEYMEAVGKGLYQADGTTPKPDYEKFFDKNDDGSYTVKTEYTVYANATKDGEEGLYQQSGGDLTVAPPSGGYTPKYGFEKFFETDDDGNYVVDPDNPPCLKVKKEYQDYMGSPLFSNNANGDDPTGITAANISVAKGWENGDHRILRSKDPNADEQSTLQDNIDHMLSQLMSKHDFKTNEKGGGTYFTGTFQEMLTDTIAGTLAKDTNITTTMLNNYTVTAEELYLDRDAVMGVDLNDETMNMMQFQKAYSAACRLMTTYDGMIDKLVNGTAI